MSSSPDVFIGFPNYYFVETGTHEGAGINHALSVGFPRVYSIELSEEFYLRAKQNFSTRANVTIIHGPSETKLWEVIRDIPSPITFWLDAHFSGGVTAKGERLCPALQELEAIARHPIKTHTILVDDRRLMGTDEFGYVSEEEIREAILRINPNYTFTYRTPFRELPNDVLVATVPFTIPNLLSPKGGGILSVQPLSPKESPPPPFVHDTREGLARRAYENGMCLLATERERFARCFFERALEFGMEVPQLLTNLARLALLEGDAEGGIHYLQRLLHTAPSSETTNLCAELLRAANLRYAPPTPPSPAHATISMSMLGVNGRFGNQFFQYAFMRIYARIHHLRLELPTWIGRSLFGLDDLPLNTQLPALLEAEGRPFPPFSALPEDTDRMTANVDLQGYCQYPTKLFAPFKHELRSFFRPVPAVERVVAEREQALRSRGKTLVALHIRRGDQSNDPHYCTPTKVYVEWLRATLPTVADPIVYIATDSPHTVLPDFAEFSPVTIPDSILPIQGAEFYPDFWILSNADLVAISNSSFSLAATLMNTRGSGFFRPNEEQSELVPYDPWNCRCP